MKKLYSFFIQKMFTRLKEFLFGKQDKIISITSQDYMIPGPIGVVEANFNNCLNLMEIGIIPHGLESLGLFNCPQLSVWHRALPSSLQYLEISDCPKLEEFPNLHNHKKLRTLIIKNCPKLRLCQLPKNLEIFSCIDSDNVLLDNFPDKLEMLVLSDNNLVGLRLPSNLERLELIDCPNLTAIVSGSTDKPGVFPKKLSHLDITRCPQLCLKFFDHKFKYFSWME